MLLKVHRDVKCAASWQNIKRKVGGRQSSRGVDAAYTNRVKVLVGVRQSRQDLKRLDRLFFSHEAWYEVLSYLGAKHGGGSIQSGRC